MVVSCIPIPSSFSAQRPSPIDLTQYYSKNQSLSGQELNFDMQFGASQFDFSFFFYKHMLVFSSSHFNNLFRFCFWSLRRKRKVFYLRVFQQWLAQSQYDTLIGSMFLHK